MSQPLLTLRPPPNVEYVQGYPGIQPSSQDDRPNAAVKGTIEVRPSPGLRAKWLQIELRKVETLPGNAGVFFDYVGASPINIWKAQNEWDVLESHDFPFHIRIPESVPPTILLEKGCGIRYELMASLCIRGKKGLLRKDATTTHTTTAAIVIDKHELHATWPIYSQPDEKKVRHGAVELIVNRARTCYGPGERVSIVATVKSDDLSPCVLHKLDFALQETFVFRAGPHGAHGKKGGPQVRTGSVGGQRVQVDVTLYGGTQYRAELGCVIPPGHGTATVNSARHIDVSYTMHVNALLSNGKILELDMPVTLSNWPRHVSEEAMRRIGPVPNLSLHVHGRSPHEIAALVAGQQLPSPPPPSNNQFGTAPAGMMSPQADTDEYGRLQQGARQFNSVAGPGGPSGVQAGLPNGASISPPPGKRIDLLDGAELSSGRIAQTNPQPPQAAGAPSSSSPVPPFGSASTTVAASGRPNTGGNAPNRLAIVNLAETDDWRPSPPSTVRQPNGQTIASTNAVNTYERRPAMQAEGQPTQSSLPGYGSPPAAQVVHYTAGGPPPANRPGPWLTAEEEKKRLYDQARAAADRTQGILDDRSGATGGSVTGGAANTGAAASASTPAPAPAVRVAKAAHRYGGSMSTPWPAAEEEKKRLFDEAQAVANRTQLKAQRDSTTPRRSSSSAPESSPPASKRRQPLEDSVESHADDQRRLFEKAQAAALNHQALITGQPLTLGQPVGTTFAAAPLPTYGNGVPTALTPGAALYQQALAAMKQSAPKTTAQSIPKPASPPATAPPRSPPPAAFQGASSRPPPPVTASFPSAAEEKAAMRYHEARRAVEDRQNGDAYGGMASGTESGPVPYDQLFPGPPPPAGSVQPAGSGSSSSNPQPVQSEPPPFKTVGSEPPAFESVPFTSGAIGAEGFDPTLSEKERARRAFAARDAVAAGVAPTAPLASEPSSSSSRIENPHLPTGTADDLPPAFSPSLPAFDPNLSEKERIRRAFAAADAAAAAAGAPAPPPSFNAMGSSVLPRPASPTMVPGRSISPSLVNPIPTPPLRISRGNSVQVGSMPIVPAPPPIGAVPDATSRRPQPEPPRFNGPARPLTAAEEKAKLKIQYEAADQASAGPSTTPLEPPPRPPTASSAAASDVMSRDPSIRRGKQKAAERSPSPHRVDAPPPLMPRPPMEYIQETREQDNRLRQQSESLDSSWAADTTAPILDSVAPVLDVGFRPMSPIDIEAFRPWMSTPAPTEQVSRPPLPPKIPMA